MKITAILLAMLTFSAILTPTASALASTYVPHEDPAAATETLDAYSFLTNYAEILGLVASRAYENASRLLEQLKFISVPEDLRYIINRYSNLTQEIITVLNNLDTQLDQAEKLLDQYRLEEAGQILENAGILVAKAQILLTDLQEATSTLSSRLGVFATSADSQVKQAYNQLQQILQRLKDLIDRFHELLTQLNEGKQQIEQKQLKPTELTLNLNTTNVFVGQYIEASGRLTTSGQSFANRTITLLIDGQPTITTTTNTEGTFHTTAKIPYIYVHIMTIRALYTPIGADKGTYLAAISPTLTLNVNFYETKLEATIPDNVHPGRTLIINGKVSSQERPLNERAVKIFLDGKLLSETATNQQGTFSSQTILNPQTSTGTHRINIIVEPSGIYAGATTTKLFNVTKIATHIEIQAPTFAILPADLYIEGKITTTSGPLANTQVKVKLSDTTLTTNTAQDGSFNVTLKIPLNSIFAGPQELNITAHPAEPWQAPTTTQTSIFILNIINIGLVLTAFTSAATLLYLKAAKNKPPKQNKKPQTPTTTTTNTDVDTDTVEVGEAVFPSKPELKFTGVKGEIIQAYLKALKSVESATGSSLKAQMTLREFLQETKPKLNEAADSFTQLTNITEKTLYAPFTPKPQEGKKASELAQKIERVLNGGNA